MLADIFFLLYGHSQWFISIELLMNALLADYSACFVLIMTSFQGTALAMRRISRNHNLTQAIVVIVTNS